MYFVQWVGVGGPNGSETDAAILLLVQVGPGGRAVGYISYILPSRILFSHSSSQLKPLDVWITNTQRYFTTMYSLFTTVRGVGINHWRPSTFAAFAPSLRQSRRVRWNPGIRPASSKSGSNNFMNRSRLRSILATSATMALGVFLYASPQSRVRMDLTQNKQDKKMDSKSSEKLV